jgi:hypothetical protein
MVSDHIQLPDLSGLSVPDFNCRESSSIDGDGMFTPPPRAMPAPRWHNEEPYLDINIQVVATTNNDIRADAPIDRAMINKAAGVDRNVSQFQGLGLEPIDANTLRTTQQAIAAHGQAVLMRQAEALDSSDSDKITERPRKRRKRKRRSGSMRRILKAKQKKKKNKQDLYKVHPPTLMLSRGGVSQK